MDLHNLPSRALKTHEDEMLTRDNLMREYRARSGTFPALLLVYMLIVGTMAAAAFAIV